MLQSNVKWERCNDYPRQRSTLQAQWKRETHYLNISNDDDIVSSLWKHKVAGNAAGMV